MGKTFFIDTTRCTACRGCQVACKEWKLLPATETKQQGSHQNPPDLNGSTLKVVRFHEYKTEAGKVVWNFFSDQCRHCLEPPCKDMANEYVKDAVVTDKKTGAVIYTEATKSLSKEAFEGMRESCPYNIPRRDEKTGLVMKCDMCYDRVNAGLLPMCVKACPTKAMNFGDRDEMLKLAEQRLTVVKKEYPEAQLVDADFVNVIYLISDKPERYHTAMVGEDAFRMTRKTALARLLSPVNVFQNII
ncbi:MAG: formate dehydrogenase [Deltaproteobacteria bacterium]|nr:formate dehydrogenase [Deltaproteobacteria bacterium]